MLQYASNSIFLLLCRGMNSSADLSFSLAAASFSISSLDLFLMHYSNNDGVSLTFSYSTLSTYVSSFNDSYTCSFDSTTSYSEFDICYVVFCSTLCSFSVAFCSLLFLNSIFSCSILDSLGLAGCSPKWPPKDASINSWYSRSFLCL